MGKVGTYWMNSGSQGAPTFAIKARVCAYYEQTAVSGLQALSGKVFVNIHSNINFEVLI